MPKYFAEKEEDDIDKAIAQDEPEEKPKKKEEEPVEEPKKEPESKKEPEKELPIKAKIDKHLAKKDNPEEETPEKHFRRKVYSVFGKRVFADIQEYMADVDGKPDFNTVVGFRERIAGLPDGNEKQNLIAYFNKIFHKREIVRTPFAYYSDYEV